MDDAERARIKEQARIGAGELVKASGKMYLKVVGIMALVVIVGFVGCSVLVSTAMRH